jgi:hypothetical protein
MKTYRYLTPEIIAKRSEGLKAFVEKGIENDKAARGAFIAAAAAGAVGVGAAVAVAASPHGLPTTAPTVPAVPNNGIVSIQSLPLGTTTAAASTDAVGSIAAEAADKAILRHDGKKVDTFEKATPSFKNNKNIQTQDNAYDTGRGPVSNAARAGGVSERTQGEEAQITGHGAARIIGNKIFTAPSVKPLNHLSINEELPR